MSLYLIRKYTTHQQVLPNVEISTPIDVTNESHFIHQSGRMQLGWRPLPCTIVRAGKKGVTRDLGPMVNEFECNTFDNPSRRLYKRLYNIVS